MKVSDHEIVRGLVNQVLKASKCGPETDVVTFITKPMWKSFCRYTGIPPNSKPSDWNGVGNTYRVFGSKTVVVPSKGIWSVSLKVEINPAQR